MKYFVLIVLLVIAWTAGELLATPQGRGGEVRTFRERLKDIGLRLHRTAGILAVLLLVLLVARFIMHALNLW